MTDDTRSSPGNNGNDLTGEGPATNTAGVTNDSCGGCSGRNRSRSNFWVNVTTALVFCALVGTGLLLEFVLCHGTGNTWLGLGRHDWGEVHFWLSAGLVGLIVVHLLLHRDWIARCWTRFAGSLKSPLTWTLMAAGVALVVLPFAVPAEQGPGHGRRGRHAALDGGARDGRQRPRADRPRGRQGPRADPARDGRGRVGGLGGNRVKVRGQNRD